MCSDFGTPCGRIKNKNKIVAGRKVEVHADKLTAACALHKYASPQYSISSLVYLKGRPICFTVLKILPFPFLNTLV